MRLHHCIYASVVTDGMSHDQLVALLEQSRAANATVGVTGMLLHLEGNFFQVLEGDVEVVHSVLERIARDPRHHGIVRIIDEPLHRRQFGEWSMGFASASAADLQSLSGFNDFYSGASCLTTLGEGRAKKLLAAFARGRWQRTLLAQAS